MPLDSTPTIIPLGRLKGRPLDAISLSHNEDLLHLDVRFEGGHCLELDLRVGYHVSGNLVNWVNGDSQVVKTVHPRKRR